MDDPHKDRKGLAISQKTGYFPIMTHVDYTRMKTRLKAAGKTQGDLAAFLGIGSEEVSKYLNGKHKMGAERYLKIEAFLAEAERKAQRRGVAESAHASFEHKQAPGRFITLEEARALKANPPPKLQAEERERLIRELGELSEAYKLLPRANNMTDDGLLGYDEFGVPSR